MFYLFLFSLMVVSGNLSQAPELLIVWPFELWWLCAGGVTVSPLAPPSYLKVNTCLCSECRSLLRLGQGPRGSIDQILLGDLFLYLDFFFLFWLEERRQCFDPIGLYVSREGIKMIMAETHFWSFGLRLNSHFSKCTWSAYSVTPRAF